jgi:hypothetical protein
MKKLFLSLITLLACLQFAKAQRTSGTQFSASVGINGSQVTDSYDNSDAVAGLNLGIAVDHYFSNRWSIYTGLNYQQKGWGNGYVSFDDGSEIDGVNYRTHYLTVPVLANWHFGRTRNWYLNFGPYIGFLLSTSESSKTVINLKDEFNTVDGGFAFNIGVKIPITRQSHFFIEYGGQGGAANVLKYPCPSVQNAPNSLNVGIGF